MQGVQIAVPFLFDLRQCCMGSVGLCVFANESANLLQTICLTQGKDDFSPLTRSQHHFCRHCRAGIKARVRAAGQPHARQGGGR